jgi:AraC family transcriptional regulator
MALSTEYQEMAPVPLYLRAMDSLGYRERLQDAIEFIELHLKDDLPLHEVARQANASLYHFHRLFRAFVGESLMEYIRHRRLSGAARALVETERPIIEVALDFGYSAPESFLRAFKAMFGTTPSSFRKKGRLPAAHRKAVLLGDERPAMRGGVTMVPHIINASAFTIYGTLIHTTHGACREEVAGLWARERGDGKVGELARRAGRSSVYGVCFGACEGCGPRLETDSEAFPYLVGWEAGEGLSLPEGLVEMKVPASSYAIFRVDGGEEEIGKAVEAIYGEWLPASSMELADSPVLEKYSIDWTGAPGEGMEIWLPVKARE